MGLILILTFQKVNILATMQDVSQEDLKLILYILRGTTLYKHCSQLKHLI